MMNVGVSRSIIDDKEGVWKTSWDLTGDGLVACESRRRRRCEEVMMEYWDLAGKCIDGMQRRHLLRKLTPFDYISVSTVNFIMPETPAISQNSVVTGQEVNTKPKKKICCACPETKRLRDECIVEHGESACTKWIEAHKQCLRDEGFNV